MMVMVMMVTRIMIDRSVISVPVMLRMTRVRLPLAVIPVSVLLVGVLLLCPGVGRMLALRIRRRGSSPRGRLPSWPQDVPIRSRTSRCHRDVRISGLVFRSVMIRRCVIVLVTLPGP